MQRVPARISKFELFVESGLTERQAVIADMIRHGFRYKEIAHVLGISEKGVLYNLKEILQILGLSNRKELVGLWRNG